MLACNRATDFTTDHGKTAWVFERFERAHYGIDMLMTQRFSGLAAVYGSKTIPPGIQKQIDDVFQIPGGLGARYVPPTQPVDSARRQEDARRITDALQRSEIVAHESR